MLATLFFVNLSNKNHGHIIEKRGGAIKGCKMEKPGEGKNWNHSSA